MSKYLQKCKSIMEKTNSGKINGSYSVLFQRCVGVNRIGWWSFIVGNSHKECCPFEFILRLLKMCNSLYTFKVWISLNYLTIGVLNDLRT